MIVDVMTEMLNAFKYEKELSEYCRGHHVTKVIFVKDFGEEHIDGYTIPIVPYLIFDLADGDVRKLLHFSENLDISWRLKSLHSIAVGLKQLHYIEVSHQDLKPSNVLLIKGDTQIGDIGRSICKSFSGPWDNLNFSGDYNYAPPEIMYGYYERDWNKRVFATDCYLLGSMVVFYFLGISMSALLLKYIPENFKWTKWRGSFGDIEAYVLDAFEQALSEFEAQIKPEYLRKELRWSVERLCYPIPEKRGHPKNIHSMGSSFNLERFISKFDLLRFWSETRALTNG